MITKRITNDPNAYNSFRWTGENHKELRAFLGKDYTLYFDGWGWKKKGSFRLAKLSQTRIESIIAVDVNDYIVTHIDGSVWAYPPAEYYTHFEPIPSLEATE